MRLSVADRVANALAVAFTIILISTAVLALVGVPASAASPGSGVTCVIPVP